MLKRIQVTLRSKDDGTTGLTGMKRVPEVCQMKQMQRKCNANATQMQRKCNANATQMQRTQRPNMAKHS